MTREILLAQAEVLEWARQHIPADGNLSAHAAIKTRAAELRAEAVKAVDATPIVDGSKPYYVEIDGVRRKYLPSGDAAEPQPVAWMAGGTVFAESAKSLPPEVFLDLSVDPASNWIPLYAHPDPRIAELEAYLQQTMAALKRLTFCARTTGGTAGPDAELMQACETAETALSLLAANTAIESAERIAELEGLLWETLNAFSNYAGQGNSIVIALRERIRAALKVE